MADLEPITWTGDLEDCSAHWQGLCAEVEHFGDDDWFASINEDGIGFFNTSFIFYSTTDGVSFKSGEAARKWCEVLMRAWAAGIRWEERQV